MWKPYRRPCALLAHVPRLGASGFHVGAAWLAEWRDQHHELLRRGCACQAKDLPASQHNDQRQQCYKHALAAQAGVANTLAQARGWGFFGRNVFLAI